MSEQIKNTKKVDIEEPPEIFPPLTKRVLNLDDLIATNPMAQKLGVYAISLDNLKKNSIYKKLLSDVKNKDIQNNLNPQNMKEIRNKYLKRLVESNPFYFPKELGLDEYKKPTNSKEYQIKKLLIHLEEVAKKAMLKSDLQSRKNSTNVMKSRKESFLDNKRKRTDSLYEEIDNKKHKKEKEIEENGEELNDYEDHESYNEDEDYVQADDDDSQNYNYSYDDGNDDGDY